MNRFKICAALSLTGLLLARAPAVASEAESDNPFVSPVSATPHPWTHSNFSNAPESFQFAIVGDRTGETNPGVFERAVGKLNLLQPEFVISVGDLIQGFLADADAVRKEWDELHDVLRQLDAPFFFVPGNHDISNSAMAEVWRQRFGPSYYHFLYRDVLFVCLDTEAPSPGHISQEQVDYAAEVLKANPAPRWTFVFLHRPLWEGAEKHPGWMQVEALLRDRPHTVFAGHNHTYCKYERHGSKYIRLGATGGGAPFRNQGLGTLQHLTWVTMTADGPRIALLSLDGILDEDIYTEAEEPTANLLRYGGWVEAGGLRARSPLFSDGEARIRLKNKGSLPLRVSGAFEPHPSLAVHPAVLEETVPPYSTAEIVVRVHAEKDTPVADFSPLRVALAAECILDGRPPMTAKKVLEIPLQLPNELPDNASTP